jgi:dTDP-glucose 4,6-dehydratase
VQDRPGHDRRYDMDITKIRAELGWQPRYDIESGLRATVEWYLNNQDWVKSVLGDEGYAAWLEKNYAKR